ncbi:LytTR family DNA-binding domain-containing protein [Emticicia sp. C21]|uniref:LytR/AlgR family response regulator transcription factor n=1 Tax=Emticicia sp. C21 TaxID=2302915 RepID=UPI000E3523A6|nr:LytTR family DNA-binding domain-containing protein [Emticicia sp. C21]RFS14397.1 LytTR family transcriptional regulator [Emticicia sp. C21]
MKAITAFSQHYTGILSNKLFQTSIKFIFLLNTISILLTYLFDFASCHLCYLKLVIIFCTNSLFWFISFPYFIEKTGNLFGHWRKIITLGMAAICLNQLLVVLGWVSIIGAFYDCLSLDLIPPIVLQNNILFSILSFLLVVSCVFFENAKKNANSSPSIINNPISQIESVNYLKSVSIKNGTTTTLIPVEKIYWIEADDNTIEFRTQLGKFVSYQSLKSIEAQLNPEVFGRIYRSTIVNKTYIKKIQSLSSGDAVVSLDNGENLKMSRHYKTHFNCGANL